MPVVIAAMDFCLRPVPSEQPHVNATLSSSVPVMASWFGLVATW